MPLAQRAAQYMPGVEHDTYLQGIKGTICAPVPQQLLAAEANHLHHIFLPGAIDLAALLPWVLHMIVYHRDHTKCIKMQEALLMQAKRQGMLEHNLTRGGIAMRSDKAGGRTTKVPMPMRLMGPGRPAATSRITCDTTPALH